MYSFLFPAPLRVFIQALKFPYYSQAAPTLVSDSFLRSTSHGIPPTFARRRSSCSSQEAQDPELSPSFVKYGARKNVKLHRRAQIPCGCGHRTNRSAPRPSVGDDPDTTDVIEDEYCKPPFLPQPFTLRPLWPFF